jgi:hypothetical protein
MSEFLIAAVFAAGFGVLALKARKLCGVVLLAAVSLLNV